MKIVEFEVTKDVFGHPIGTIVYTEDEGRHCYLNKELTGDYNSHTYDWEKQNIKDS